MQHRPRPLTLTLVAIGCFLLAAYSSFWMLRAVLQGNQVLIAGYAIQTIVTVASGFGLLQLLNWARILIMIRCVLTVLQIPKLINHAAPISTINIFALGFCIFTFFYLIRSETAIIFRGQVAPGVTPPNS